MIRAEQDAFIRHLRKIAERLSRDAPHRSSLKQMKGPSAFTIDSVDRQCELELDGSAEPFGHDFEQTGEE
jgi:hypothetical protein